MARKCISISKKVQIVEEVQQRLNKGGESLRLIAQDFGVAHSQLIRWQAQLAKFEQLLTKGQGRRVNPAAKSVHPGPKSSLEHIEQALLIAIFELREQGMAVSIRMVINMAAQLDRDFKAKEPVAKDAVVRRFVEAHGLVHRIHTHQSQKHELEVQQDAKDWMQQTRLRLIGAHRDRRFIINMDQTPIFFAMLPRTTLSVKGSRTVTVRTCTSSTLRVTVAATVTAAGSMLPPMIIFKGKKGGRIEREFAQYHEGGLYSVQEKAWMSEPIMLEWVEQVLKPYVATAPDGVQPVLMLDSYRCHMMASVVRAINDLGVQVEHIPGGCTSLCQPIDVGIGKPLKDRVRRLWEDWMLSQDQRMLQFNAPSRQTLAHWVVSSLFDLSSTTIKNSWRKREYSYFDDTDDDEAAAEVNLADTGEDHAAGDENNLVGTDEHDAEDGNIQAEV